MRGIGWVISALLALVCVGLIVCSIAFGSNEVVKLLGYNIYIAQTGEFEQVQEGSAVIAKRCSPYDIEQDNLILYAAENGSAALGYADDVRTVDGSYVITVSDSSSVTEIKGNSLIGKAEVSSPLLGGIILFSKTPWGILVMAVLPCLILVAVDIIRAVTSKLPPPEVVPQYKSEDEAPAPVSSLSVKPDGNAMYSRTGNTRPAKEADNVLFTYTAKQKPKETAPKKPPIIPLTDRSEEKREKPEEALSENAAGKTPVSVAARNYMDSVTASEKVKGDTAELPALPKKSKSDAFFVQNEAPQIGRQKSARAVIDLEDALASAGKHSSQRHSGKRSSAILAEKSAADLMTDDDDKNDSSRYAVDDILSGLDKKV